MNTCPSCKGPLAKNAKFCPRCGHVPKSPFWGPLGCGFLSAAGVIVIAIPLILINSSQTAQAPARTSTKMPQAHPVAAKPVAALPDFKLVKTGKQEGNLMELYSFDGEISVSALVDFCQKKKASQNSAGLYFAVVFDKEANAEFPKDPFTAAYGTEEKKLRHIRAIYSLNNRNGSSEVQFHKSNIWEHRASWIKID